MLRLGVTESDNPTADAQLLREAIGLLLEYPGKDRVNIAIRAAGRKVLLDLPVVSTGFCPDLQRGLEVLLGPNAVALETKPGLQETDLPV